MRGQGDTGKGLHAIAAHPPCLSSSLQHGEALSPLPDPACVIEPQKTQQFCDVSTVQNSEQTEPGPPHLSWGTAEH